MSKIKTKKNLSFFLNFYSSEVIKKFNPLYLKPFLYKKIRRLDMEDLVKRDENYDNFIDFLDDLAQFLELTDDRGELTSLGVFFSLNTNIFEEFYKLLILQDDDFQKFTNEILSTQKINLQDLNERKISGYFSVYSDSLTLFLKSIGLFFESEINTNLLKSWIRYPQTYSIRISNIFLNIMNSFRPITQEENYELIIKHFNDNKNLEEFIFDNNIISFAINFEEFSDFKRDFEIFSSKVQLTTLINNPEGFPNIFITDIDIFKGTGEANLGDQESNRRKTQIKNEKLRSKILRDMVKIQYNECQICAKLAVKIPHIIMEKGEPYLEVHHIIPLSKKDKKKEWNNLYVYEPQIEEIIVKTLDHPVNMITLCAYHHKMLHYEYPPWVFYNIKSSVPHFNNEKKKTEIKYLKNHYNRYQFK